MHRFARSIDLKSSLEACDGDRDHRGLGRKNRQNDFHGVNNRQSSELIFDDSREEPRLELRIGAFALFIRI